MWIHNSSETVRFSGDDHNLSVEEVHLDSSSSSSSSSIGNNSDASGGDDDGEVESSFKGSLNNLSELEEALALKRRGISSFYSGKSKSYTSLADAVSAPSIQDIVKPEDAYNRKRKNMIAHSLLILNKNPNFASKNRGPPLAHNNHHNGGGESSSRPPLPGRHRISPPTALDEYSSPRSYCPPWRSFSLSDLQHAAAAAGGAATTLTGNKRDD